MISSGATNPQERTKEENKEKQRAGLQRGKEFALTLFISGCEDNNSCIISNDAFGNTHMTHLVTIRTRLLQHQLGAHHFHSQSMTRSSRSKLIHLGKYRLPQKCSCCCHILSHTDRQTDRSSLVFRRIFRPLSSSCPHETIDRCSEKPWSKQKLQLLENSLLKQSVNGSVHRNLVLRSSFKFSATTRYEQEDKSEGMKSEALVVVVVVPNARTSLVSRRTRSVPSIVPKF